MKYTTDEEYLESMKEYLKVLKSDNSEEAKINARNSLIWMGVIDEDGNLIDHYVDHDPYLMDKPNKRK